MLIKYIEQLKVGISKSIPEPELLKNILEVKRPELEEAVQKDEKLDSIRTNEVINEIVNLLYKNDIETARKYGNYISLTKEEMLEIAKIAFDIAKYKNKNENMFNLTAQFLLDEKRVNVAVLPKIFNLIQNNKYNEALSLKRKYKNIISEETLKKYGAKYFEKVMTFETSQIERDYKKAFFVKEIYDLDDKTTIHLADAQYGYNIMHENFLQAAEIAKIFKLPSEKLEKAATFVFKKKFSEFIQKFDNKEYSGKVKIEENDPYKSAIELINKYKLLDKINTKSKELLECVKEIKNIGYSFLKKLTSSDEYKDIDLLTKSFFCSSIIVDFNLSDSSDIKRYEGCENITAKILNEIDENLNSVGEAFDYQDILIKIYKQSSIQKKAAKNIGTRIFEIYLENNQLKPMREIYDEFQLKVNDVFSSLKKKSLEFLESKNFDSFNKLNELFDIIPILNNNDDFLRKLYHVYRELIYSDELKEAHELTKIFKLSKQKRLEPIRAKLLELFSNNKDDEALKIISTFSIENNQIRDILVNIYQKRTIKHSEPGYMFRNRFTVSIMDIGLITWFFTEVVNIPFLRK